MKRKCFFVILFLVLAIFLSGCSGSGVVTPSTNLTGNWTMTNSSASGTTTSKCNIVDSSGSLTIYNFYIVNQEYINWNTGYGTFNKPILTANISGSYLNQYGSTVSTIVYFEGTINTSGISGSGTWYQTFSVSGYTWIYEGTTIFIKG